MFEPSTKGLESWHIGVVARQSWSRCRVLLRPLIEKYYRGSDSSAEQRIKLFKLIWDATGTEFGARHALYERNYSGNNEQVRLDVVNFARVKGHLAEFNAFVDRCMSEYDLRGWTVPPWDWEEKN